MSRSTQQRRGIVLMIVLSLLTLFMLMGVTFLISSRQYVKGARARAKHEIVGVDPRKHTDEAIYQLLRGTETRSVAGPHSLLEDIYGRDSFQGTATSVNAETNAGGQHMFYVVSFPKGSFVPDTNFYSGRVVSFFNFNQTLPLNQRPAGPISTRVTDSGVDPGDPTRAFLRIEPFEVDQSFVPTALTNSAFLINGQPFNGTGAGYRDNPPTPPNVDEIVTLVDGNSVNWNLEAALLPNFGLYATGQQANVGGADESWDAVDYQNMCLAMAPARATSAESIIPSFHRPALANYWFAWIRTNILTAVADPNDQIRVFRDPYGVDNIRNNADDSAAPWSSVPILQRDFIVELKSHFILRPLSELHTNFPDPDPTSPPLPELAWEISGPWDVDNDNDGIPDSIWIDIGLPVFTGTNGRVVKPLVAMLVKDMDGRFNVNAHGSYAQLTGNYTATVPGLAAAPVTLPRGRGFGPAEIFMGDIFASTTEFQNTLAGRYGTGASPQPGQNATDDSLIGFKTNGIPSTYAAATVSSFLSPPDVWGRSAIGLDFGQPVYYHVNDNTAPANDTQITDDPYELNLGLPGSDNSPIDAPYTNADLERLLRFFDGDAASHPSRLLTVAPTTLDGATTTAHINRQLITTESRHLPVANIRYPAERRAMAASQTPTLIDLFAEKLVPPASATPAAKKTALEKMVPLEMLHGQLFNLNRLFGDGQDNAPLNNVADDPTENDPLMSPLMGGPGVARHYFAKNLYCLMLMLMDDTYVFPAPYDTPEMTRRRIAQWAINVVEFRDADSIMSPFEYDFNPWNGWDVDGAVGTADDSHAERRLVWGCERPELLITEIVAWHDRRTEDLDTASPTAPDPTKPDKTTSAGMDPDDDFDQRLLPRGGFFVELFNPWAGGDLPPNELYDGLAGVRLNKLNGASTPVWRLLVVKGGSKNNDPDIGLDATDPRPPVQPADVDRSIYFANPTGATTPIADHKTPFYPDNTIPIAPLLPGRYAVAGSAGTKNGNAYISTIGRRTDADEATPDLKLLDTRQVVITPNANANVHQVDVRNNQGAGTVDPPPANILPAGKPPVIGIPINQPRSVSVSEPVAGYSNTPENVIVAGVHGELEYQDPLAPGTAKPVDVPVDTDAELKKDGTTLDYCVVHLQRLANPLAAWDAAMNPYLTLDTMSCDITAFNGVTNDADPNAADDPDYLASLQRGEDTTDRLLWKHGQHDAGFMLTDVAAGAGDHFFDRVLQHTLGFLNEDYGPAFYAGGNPRTGFPDPSTNSHFPWLTWFNRPFDNPLQLMLVPHTSQSELTFVYDDLDPALPANPYLPGAASAPYPYLLNFFHTGVAGTPPAAPHLYRLFDYVETPSPFVGTERWYDSTVFATAPNLYQPPFSYLSRFRDPGRININTIFDAVSGPPADTWKGIMKAFPDWDPTTPAGQQLWQDVFESRQGYPGTGFDDTVPTRFGNPFRSAHSADLAPLLNLQQTNSVQATLLRSKLSDPTTPLFDFSPTDPYQDSGRNPYFKYQGLNRLSNLFTTHSNVYAVWITVGYFDVDQQIVPTKYVPDGYILGREHGSEDGTTNRHRAFYLIDRSIPVAFETGVNHNVDRAILVKRFIE